MTMIDGRTKLIAHLGFPTETFKAPMIYNPYFRRHGINAVVVPMGCKAPDYAGFLRLLFRLSNIHGALVTMPHKVATVAQLDEASVSVKVAGACNAIRIDPDGRLVGEMFDGDGFVRGAAQGKDGNRCPCTCHRLRRGRIGHRGSAGQGGGGTPWAI
jgi:shikimate dehydrogenase